MAFLGGFFGFKTWGSAFLMAPIFAVSFTTHAQAQLGVTIKEDSFLTENARLPVPCQESLQTFKTGSAMDLQPLAAAALSCAPLFGHCRARPELKDPVGYLGDFNETLVRQVVGVHMDLLYRKGIYAAGNKPDGSPTHPSQVWADPKGLDSPVCNIACGEINDARGVRKDQAFAKTCGLWGWENKQWYYVGGQKLNPWQCRGIHDHIWDMITFSDANSQPVSRAINQNLDRTMGRSIDTSGTGPWSGADDDCEGAFIEDFAVSTRFAAYQTGVLVQATWFALDEVLDEANSDQHSFRVSPECAGLAADAVNDLRIGLGALEELKLCGPTKKLQDGSVVVNDLAHVGADPNHPERDADRPPTQLDAQIRALVVATQASHLTRAAECEVYARAHKRFQERTLTPEAMIADAERIHWSLFEPNFFASETLELDDTDDAMILDVMWGFGKTLLPALGLNWRTKSFYNQWINRFTGWMFEPNRGITNGSATANPKIQIEGFPSMRLPGTAKTGKERAQITFRTGANVEILPLTDPVPTSRQLDLNALPPVPTGCQMIDRIAHPNATSADAASDLTRAQRLTFVPWGLRAGAWVLSSVLATPALARVSDPEHPSNLTVHDEYYHFIKNRCNGMNGILLTQQLARDCCEYAPDDTEHLHPSTKLGATQCPGALVDLIADVHERAVPLPLPGGPTGGGGSGSGGTVDAAANALRALASNASVAHASPGPDSMNGGVYAQTLGAGLGTTSSDVAQNTGGTGSRTADRNSGLDRSKKSGSGSGSGGNSAAGSAGATGNVGGSAPSSEPSVDPNAEAKRLAASGDAGAGSTYAAVRGAGGGSGGSGNTENTVDRVEWNIPGQGGTDAGALAETSETEDPANYFDRLGPNDSLFKKVSDRYRKKRPQLSLP